MNSTTYSYPRFLVITIEDYYIDLHTYSYSKTKKNDAEKGKKRNNIFDDS